jgi:hypothetical protein
MITTTRRFNPFHRVNCTNGAPMGRIGDSIANLQGVKTLYAAHQGGGQGYDKGGAYWGLPSDVWAVWARLDDETLCTYVRAKSRQDAINQVRNA